MPPVRDILLDSNGNRVLVRGDYGFASGSQAVKQGIECRVRLHRSEYWLDESQGVDYLGKILVRNPVAQVVKAEIGRAIAGTPDVTRVTNTGYTPPDSTTRAAAVTYEAASIFGRVSGSAAVPA